LLVLEPGEGNREMVEMEVPDVQLPEQGKTPIITRQCKETKETRN